MLSYSLVGTDAWDAPYNDAGNVLNNFVGYLKECYGTFKNSPLRHPFPYLSLVQSSGHGKSRLLFKSSEHIYLCYYNMNLSNCGYPKGSSRATELLSAKTFTEQTSTFFALHCLREFHTFLDSSNAVRSPSDWFTYQIQMNFGTKSLSIHYTQWNNITKLLPM